ncbi:MAG: hypothetical protein QOF44_3435 [Streptomyces sp.]|nr:hypothetical protein [Streptomyces sp.]
MKAPDAPLFRDPVHDGAADPTLIRHRETGEWWMFYTARRADLTTEGFGWVHGTDIGIATSADGGRTWTYRGIAQGLAHEPGRNTYWAPEILWHDGTHHMYVSYVSGVPTDWGGEAHILHYTSQDLEHWRFESVLGLGSDRVIDASVWLLPGGGWRMWFKDETGGSHIHAADSADLYDWRPVGPALDKQAQEGPNVFRHAGSYWMVTDYWSGLLVYRSEDLTDWVRQDEPLLAGRGSRPGDEAIGHHAFALSQGDDAYLFYFTHPADGQRSCVQAAPLTVRDGRLRCERDAAFGLELRADRTPALRGGDMPS